MNKTLKLLGMGLVMVTTAISLQSCLNDDDDNYYYYNGANALVTLKTSSSGHLLLQLDDSTLLYPVNISTSPYNKKELRALVRIRDPKDNELDNGIIADGLRNVYVTWIDSVRTKPIARSYGLKNDSAYGKDPLDILNSWMTVVEDGYLTVNFRTYFGNDAVHVLNLVKGSSPYELVLHQDAKGDIGGRLGDGIIAFRLDSLPDTKGKMETFTLKWNSFDGEKSHQFKYRTRN